MILTLLFIGGLWLIAAFLYLLFRARLPKRLRARWISIAGAISAFVVAEAELATKKSFFPHILFYVVVIISIFGSRFLIPKFRDHVVNLTIFLILLVFAITYIYLRTDVVTVVYYIIAFIIGILLYLAFRSNGSFGVEHAQVKIKLEEFTE